MQLPRSHELTYSRGRPAVDAEPLFLRRLAQLGHVVTLPLVALGTGVYRVWAGPTPSISGALSLREAWGIRHRLRSRLQSLRATGAAFQLGDVVPFRWRRLGVFAPMEDLRVHFPAADRRIAELLQTCDRHVVVLERASGGLVYLTFGPADEIPSAVGVCVDADRIVVSRVSRDCIDYLDFAAAPSTVEP